MHDVMTSHITVIGTGYLGATHAACMAEHGLRVLGVDVDEHKIKRLSAGEVPFYEPGLEPLLRKHLESGRLSFTTSYREAATFADVHFVCVGTPQSTDGEAADLTQLESVFTRLARHIDRPALLVGKSTVPVGTAERMQRLVAQLAPEAEVAWNPEFLREGRAVEDTLRPDRLVFGVQSERAERVLREVHQSITDRGCPVVTTDLATAELAKCAANAFLATKISFINAMSELCDAAGADAVALADAIGHDERIGRQFLNAGLGFGGGCLPKDIRAVRARSLELGVEGPALLLREVDAINVRCRTRAVQRVESTLGGSAAGARVAVLGAAFKPDTDDVRDSPALAVAAHLDDLGAQVRVYDPQARANAQRAHPQLSYADSLHEAVHHADVVVLATEWAGFREVSPHTLATMVTQRKIVDLRNALDPESWRSAGWTYHALGRL